MVVADATAATTIKRIWKIKRNKAKLQMQRYRWETPPTKGKTDNNQNICTSNAILFEQKWTRRKCIRVATERVCASYARWFRALLHCTFRSFWLFCWLKFIMHELWKSPAQVTLPSNQLRVCDNRRTHFLPIYLNYRLAQSLFCNHSVNEFKEVIIVVS